MTYDQYLDATRDPFACDSEPGLIDTFGAVHVYTDDEDEGTYDVGGHANHPSGAMGCMLSLRAHNLDHDAAMSLAPMFDAALSAWSRLPVHEAFACLGRAYRWHEAEAHRAVATGVLNASSCVPRMHAQTAERYERAAEAFNLRPENARTYLEDIGGWPR